MTSAERKMLDELNKTLQEIKSSNEMFQNQILARVLKTEQMVEQKHLPLQFENNIMNEVKDSISKSIRTVLESYNSPLSKLTESIIKQHETEFRKIIDDCITEVLKMEGIGKELAESISHKIARALVSFNESALDKIIHDLKQDQTFKAKMVIAISDLVNKTINK